MYLINFLFFTSVLIVFSIQFSVAASFSRKAKHDVLAEAAAGGAKRNPNSRASVPKDAPLPKTIDHNAKAASMLATAQMRSMEGRVRDAEELYKTIQRKYYGYLNKRKKALLESDLAHLQWHRGAQDEALQSYGRLFGESSSLFLELGAEDLFNARWHYGELLTGKKSFGKPEVLVKARRFYEKEAGDELYYRRLSQHDRALYDIGKTETLYRAKAVSAEVAEERLRRAFPWGTPPGYEPDVLAKYYLLRGVIRERANDLETAKVYYSRLMEPEILKALDEDRQWVAATAYAGVLNRQGHFDEAAASVKALVNDDGFAARHPLRWLEVSRQYTDALKKSEQYALAAEAYDKVQRSATYRRMPIDYRVNFEILGIENMILAGGKDKEVLALLKGIWMRGEYKRYTAAKTKDWFFINYLRQLHLSGALIDDVRSIIKSMFKEGVFVRLSDESKLYVRELLAKVYTFEKRHKDAAQLFEDIYRIHGKDLRISAAFNWLSIRQLEKAKNLTAKIISEAGGLKKVRERMVFVPHLYALQELKQEKLFLEAASVFFSKPVLAAEVPTNIDSMLASVHIHYIKLLQAGGRIAEAKASFQAFKARFGVDVGGVAVPVQEDYRKLLETL